MIRIYFLIIAAKGHQFISDFLGVFIAPAKTLRDISDRNDWAIPMLFLCLCLTAPFPSWEATSTTIAPGRPDVSAHLILVPNSMFALPFSIVLFYLGVYALMRIFYRQQSNWQFFRMSGYIGVPYVTIMYAFTAGVSLCPDIFLGHDVLLKSDPVLENMSPVPGVIFLILLLVVLILTMRILWLALRTAYPGVSGKSRLLCLVLAVVMANFIIRKFC